MTYYDTIEEDLARAKAILARGRIELPEEEVRLHERMATLRTQGGTIYGGDTYAAYKLLESFVAEIERLRDEVRRLHAWVTEHGSDP